MQRETVTGKPNAKGWDQKRCPGRKDMLRPSGCKELRGLVPQVEVTACAGAQGDV